MLASVADSIGRVYYYLAGKGDAMRSAAGSELTYMLSKEPSSWGGHASHLALMILGVKGADSSEPVIVNCHNGGISDREFDKMTKDVLKRHIKELSKTQPRLVGYTGQVIVRQLRPGLPVEVIFPN